MTAEVAKSPVGSNILAAATVLTLSIVLAPVASAQFSFCVINGPATAQCGTQVNYIATSPFLVGQNFSATWSLINNNAGATFVGPHTCIATQACQVTVMTSMGGTVTVRVILDFGGGVLKTCQTTLTVALGGPVAGTCPPDITVPCPGPIDPSVTGTPTFNNNCGQITTTFTDVVTGSNCAGPIITRTWTATNPQGGFGTCTQNISRSSTPIITCPAPVTVPCFAMVPPSDINSVTATDCGGAVTVVHVGDVASNGTSNCSNFISRTYRATNACGVSTDCVQTITVSDTTPPSITCPGPVTVQCFSAVPSPNVALVTASDNATCGGAVTIIHVGDVATNGTSSCNNVITRTYRATDLCGNQATCTQTITVNDTTPPVLTCPTPGVSTVQCFNLVPAPNIGIVAASDNCGGIVTITHSSDVATNGTSSCNNVITRTYQGVDACGNTGTCTQMITVNDTTPPSITCPGPVNLQCFSALPPPNISSVTATDNCGSAPTVTFVSDVPTNGTSSVNNVVTRTYRATDACGNMTTCTQTITVNDTTAPTLTCAGALSVQCFSLVPVPNVASVAATDGCGGAVTVTFMGDVASNGTSNCFNVITRTYQGVDLAGNIGFCSQTITVNDTTPPTMISCPAPVTVTCFSQVPPPAPTSITATDGCGGAVAIIHLSDTPSNGNSSCNNVITRTYRATDLCGNQATCTQLITVNDTIPPVLTCPAPGVSTVQCFSLVPAPNIGIISATDNCGGAVTITHLSDVATNGTSSCNNVITRTYQGVDTCGNIGTCTQMITVNDTTPPSITCPGPLTAQCFTLLPAPNISSVTATDNCGSAPTITFVSDVATNGTSSCMNVITRTYRATDACGNMNTCTQMITVNDTTLPVLTCPTPSTVQCFSLVPPQSTTAVTATDNCGGAVTVTFVSDVASNGTSSCFNVITRTYQGVDTCGNMATCTQTITVNDTTPPVISSCPPPVTVQCFSLVPPSNIASVTATDNCGGAVTIIHLSDAATNGNSSCNNVITRTYRATDLCGNSSTCTQAITVNDTTPPVLTCPTPGVSTVQCFSLVPAPNIGIISATDNCGGLVTITFVSDVATNGTSSCNNVITRTYQGVDACGNLGTCTQMITVNDTTPPSITCPGPLTAQCFTLLPAPNISLVTATDNCGSAPTITFVSDVATNGTSSCMNVITRTYRATDACGNMNTCTQMITVNDTTPPVLTCPAPSTVQCFSLVPPQSTTAVTATDNCGGAVTVTFVSDVPSNGTSSCFNTITRTYMGVDTCGNMATCTQTITVNDTTPPVISSCPPPVTVQCFSLVPPSAIASVTATDNCGGAVTVTFVSDTPSNGTSSCNNVITRTYRATDLCGNMSTCTQAITVNDTTPPVLTCPAPGVSTVQCFSLVPAPNIGLISGTDNCGGLVTITFVSDVATNGTSSCNNVITRTYQGVDPCGNAGTCTQMITVNDTTPPSITCPGPLTAQCFTLLPAPNISLVTATDNCGSAPTITFVSDVATNGTSSCMNVVTRTYRATDACGNMNTCTQMITVNDTTPPVLTCPTATTVQCFSLLPAQSPTAVTATDNCGGAVTVTFLSDVATNGTSSCNNVITRTYQGVDLCGNMGTCTQVITVNDTTVPTLTCPTTTTSQCFSLVPAPSITAVTATDNCGGAVTVTFVSDVPTNGTSSCNNVITRTYQGVDACGNVGTCTQTITVNDTTPPTISCPTGATAQCFSAVPAPSIASVTATDNCGGAVTVIFVSDVPTNGTSSCNNVITRTYRATDACGNMNTCTQLITVNDTIVPTLTCPTAASFQCFSLVPAPSIAAVAATDNCGGAVTVTFVSDVATNGASSCANVITRTYQGADACGNVGTCTQTITVNDTTPPSITCPTAATAQCFSLVPAPNIASVTATDNCAGAVTVTFVSDVATNGTSSCNNVITRTYRATDACGNMNTCTQLITVNDTTVPTLTCPTAATSQCFSLVPAPSIAAVTATDNCGGVVTVTFVSDVATNGTSSCNNVITRTYQGVDACGNIGTCTQTISVNDTTPPTITCPNALTAQCFSLVVPPTPGLITATDNCGGAVTVTFVSDVATNGTSSCNNVITRTYRATDLCGNQSTCTQTITVNDTVLPIIGCPAGQALQCISAVPAPAPASVIAQDICGGAVTVTFVSDVPTNGTSSCNNSIVRTYQATDLCGNSNACTQTFTVNDTTPPTITCPNALTAQCFSLVVPPTPGLITATDNCGGAVTVTFVSDVATNGTSSCNNVITRTYRATDLCGNQSTCTQTITVNDTVLPIIGCPAGQALQCLSAIPAPATASVIATDICGGPVTVTFVSDVPTNGTSSCNNTITRTYQATDPCGNSNTCTQVFTVNDTTPPVISCPIDFMAMCGSPTVPGTTGMATATDNCNPAPTITFTDAVNGVCPTVPLVITRLWVANDGCNTASCTQIITLTPPPPVAPGCVFDLGGSCGNPTPTLTVTLQATTLTAMVTGAAPNVVLALAAETPLYVPPANLNGSCVLHLDALNPPSASGMFQTDATGSWTGMVNIPAYPSPTRTLLQALAVSPNGGPIGNYSLTNGVNVWRPCPPCTYRRLDWAISNGPANAIYQAQWLNVFPLGMDIGMYFPSNGNTPPNGVHWTPDVTGRTTLKQFIQGVGGQPGNLPSDAINTVVSSSGTLGRIVAVLRMNVTFNTAGFLGETNPGFANFIYASPGDPFDGQTVSQILAAADQILAGNTPPPPPYTFATFVVLIENLNEAFQGCVPSQWSGEHLL